MVGQDNNCIDRERMARARVAESGAQRSSVLGQQALPAVREVDREEIATARYEVATIIRHRHIARCSGLMGLAALNPSYALLLLTPASSPHERSEMRDW